MKIALLCALMVQATVSAAEYYVSPSGTPRGKGTMSAPWDLATALAHPPAVHPGDTIWVLAGTYGNGRTEFVSRLIGRRDAPIIVRNYRDQRATIDGALLIGCCESDPHPEQGAYVWFWGLEIKSSITVRTGLPDGTSATLDGVTALAPGVKLINLIIHDTREGIGFWKEALNGEAYGNIIYHNGFQASDRGHGHAIYAQNGTGTKVIDDNIAFNQFGMGLHIYGSEDQSYIRNMTLDGNIVFNSGALSVQGHDNNLMLGGGIGGTQNIVLSNNHFFHSQHGTNAIGLAWGGAEQNVVVKGNYFVGGETGVDIYRWNSIQFENNTAYSRARNATLLTTPVHSTLAKGRPAPESFHWDRNRYFGSDRFLWNSREFRWSDWRGATGFDRASEYQPAPVREWTFVRPNRYEPGRANIVIYNWGLQNAVPVDVSSVLTSGTAYEVRDAQNFFRGAIASGVYKGGSISIPMTGLVLDPPTGKVATTPVHTAPGFGVFVLLARSRP